MSTETEDLVALDYEMYTSLNQIQFENKTVAVDLTSLLEPSNLGFGVTYTNHSIDFEDYEMYHNFQALETLHSVEVFAKYQKALANNWNMGITLAPYLSSTFNDAVSNEDFVFSYAANFIKSWDNDGHKSYLKLGLGYGAVFGKPSFYPLLSYTKHVDEKLRYEIGFPRSGAFYKINTQSSVDFTLAPTSVYANNSSDFSLENGMVYSNSKLEFKALKAALGYTFQFDDYWSSYFSVGYLTASELTLTNNDNKIYDFDSNESLSLNLGISFNLNKK
ncbi:outer membrane beta-barrel protein [Winogradskyella vidalii]|uniref:outer membrane beta-barrel protein n=1 Tax=Winogradskyella vidalii TaxID=2615024 RepID=UPI0015CEC2C0|nr:outer membrane beta-barrel protein [Winogradskyella vidalii]